MMENTEKNNKEFTEEMARKERLYFSLFFSKGFAEN